ncbi:hypothetical protein [Proteiniphilum sp.]
MKKKKAKDSWDKLFATTSKDCCCCTPNKKSETDIQNGKTEEQKSSVNK